MTRPGGRTHSRLRIRLVASSALLSLLLVALTVTALIAVLHGEAERQIDASLRDRAAALAATVTVTPAGEVDVAGSDDALFDTPNWLFDRSGRQVEGQRLPRGLSGPIRSLSGARSAQRLVVGDWHLRAMPVRARGRVEAVAVTAVDGRPWDAALASVIRAVAAVGTLAVLGATALAGLVLARGLGPIAAMTGQAATWSREESHRRFALGAPRDEVSALAAVLDEMLDRVEDALESERRLTAEVAHELRTPLTALRAESELGLLAPPTPDAVAARFSRIRDAAVEMTDAMTTLLDAERTGSGPGHPTPLVPLVQAVATAAIGDGPVRVRILGGEDIATSVPPATVRRVLGPVLGNAVAAARSRISVELGVDGDRAIVDVEDDGDGVDPGLADDVFAAGVTRKAGGTGLGLGIARRTARTAGGDVRLVSARPARFRVVLPRPCRVKTAGATVDP